MYSAWHNVVRGFPLIMLKASQFLLILWAVAYPSAMSLLLLAVALISMTRWRLTGDVLLLRGTMVVVVLCVVLAMTFASYVYNISPMITDTSQVISGVTSNNTAGGSSNTTLFRIMGLRKYALQYGGRPGAFGLQILAALAIMGYKVATDAAKSNEFRARSTERDSDVSEAGGALERAVTPTNSFDEGKHDKEITVWYYILGTVVADWEKVSAAVVVILGMQRPDIVHVGYIVATILLLVLPRLMRGPLWYVIVIYNQVLIFTLFAIRVFLPWKDARIIKDGGGNANPGQMAWEPASGLFRGSQTMFQILYQDLILLVVLVVQVRRDDEEGGWHHCLLYRGVCWSVCWSVRGSGVM